MFVAALLMGYWWAGAQDDKRDWVLWYFEKSVFNPFLERTWETFFKNLIFFVRDLTNMSKFVQILTIFGRIVEKYEKNLDTEWEDCLCFWQICDFWNFENPEILKNMGEFVIVG